MNAKRHAMAVAVLCGLGCLVQAVLVSRAVVPSPDAVRFANAARAIERQGLVPALRVERDHPLFPAWVSTVHAAVRGAAGDFPAAWAVSVQLAAAIPLVLLVVPVYFLTAQLWGRAAGWFAGLLLCLLPELAHLGACGLGDGSHLLLLALALWALVTWLEAGRPTTEAGHVSGRRSHALWLLAAGVAAGMGALARTEALVLPAALGATLAGVQLTRRWRQPWPRLGAGAACFALGAGLVVGPYLWAMGSLNPRDAADRLLGRYDAERELGPAPAETAAAGWGLPGGRPMSFAPKDPSTSIRKWGGAAVAEELGLGLARAFGYATGLLGLLGLWCCRRRTVGPAGWLLGVFGAMFCLAAVTFAATEGYLTARHLLTLVVPAIGLCGLGVVELGRLARPRRRLIEWAAVGVAGLILVVANRAPLHESLAGHQEAARWLAAEAPEPGLVVDTRGWTSLYSGRPTFLYEDAPLVLADARLAYVVVEQSELEYASRRARTLRALLDAAGEPVAEFPQRRALPRGRPTVVVYRWHAERFRQGWLTETARR